MVSCRCCFDGWFIVLNLVVFRVLVVPHARDLVAGLLFSVGSLRGLGSFTFWLLGILFALVWVF